MQSPNIPKRPCDLCTCVSTENRLVCDPLFFMY
uniref:Uncharacterized protein n=1 Tax=Siphoviridae sp. ct2u94 TaxID=2826277 RepID=A0A8S5QVQ6_9CAUD|nr:MAG TPA: hypothetical protein [Siphoviridae sp. ct2u94]